MTTHISTLRELIGEQKVVASIRKKEDLKMVLSFPKIKAIFVLNCDIFDLKRMTDEAKENSIRVFAHMDLTRGLGKDPVGIKFLSRTIKVDGIISTKSSLIKAAREEGLMTVQRFFMVDSEAVKTGISMAKVAKPDALEILPAFLPKYYLDIILNELEVVLIAGGLLRTRDDVAQVLSRGFQAVSTSESDLWKL